jgi:hypothetical protein
MDKKNDLVNIEVNLNLHKTVLKQSMQNLIVMYTVYNDTGKSKQDKSLLYRTMVYREIVVKSNPHLNNIFILNVRTAVDISYRIL